MYQRTGMNIRQTRQHTERDLHCIFKVEAAFIPDGIVERHATVELRHKVMVDSFALFHLTVVDIADDISVLIGIQFLAEMYFVDLLAFK